MGVRYSRKVVSIYERAKASIQDRLNSSLRTPMYEKRLILQLRETLFPRKLNRDGTLNSICPKCYATVASARYEAELALHEAAHVCNLHIDIGNYKRIGRLRP
jgi:hypothetical protein